MFGVTLNLTNQSYKYHFIIMNTTLTIDNDGILTFPPEFLEQVGWKEGDVLQWIDNHDGSWTLTKPDERV